MPGDTKVVGSIPNMALTSLKCLNRYARGGGGVVLLLTIMYSKLQNASSVLAYKR